MSAFRCKFTTNLSLLVSLWVHSDRLLVVLGGDVFIGLAGVLFVVGEGMATPTAAGGVDQMPSDGHVDSTLVWSNDPVVDGWHHADEARTSMVPRGGEGSFDYGTLRVMIYTCHTNASTHPCFFVHG
jgi:hypothetical protein